jgi:hypothetical protein
MSDPVLIQPLGFEELAPPSYWLETICNRALILKKNQFEFDRPA